MKKVMVFGTFDLVHPGHLDFFRQAKEMGDFLIVVVGTDANVEKIKGKKPLSNEQKRLDELKKVGIIDEVVIGYEDDAYRIIEEKKPDVICLGYDQNSYSGGLEQEMKKRGINIEIKRMKPHQEDIFKTSKLVS